MANLKSLAKDTAIYGLSSIVGRFLNYLLVPLYTHYMPKDSGDYGISTNVYAYTALILVLLTFGMETTLFRFANDEKYKSDTVFSTAFATVGSLTAVFLVLIFAFISPISSTLGYAAHPDYLLMMAVVVALDAIQALPFSYLRYQKRAIRFASLKMLFIVLNIALNVIYFVMLGKTSVFYVFFINLLCTGLITFFFLPDMFRIKWQFDGRLLRQMLGYSWPILILGIAGILNQVADKIIFPLVYPDEADANVQLGIYGSCVKIAMIMAMITQAFRYAYEPIVFAKSKDADKTQYYASAMKYFIIFTLLAFLCVMGWMPVLQYIIGADYREGLGVVPIVMAAEIMMGVYFNLSFWYKLIDKTIYGAWFSLAGCAMLLAVNILFIPQYGYWACAWGGVAGYGTAMVLSYIVGQQKNPIPYPVKDIALYVILAGALFCLMQLSEGWPMIASLALNTLLILLFVAFIIKRDMPLASLPIIGKKFKKTK
ncbi:MAG: lipopolysaccharide biosynthesis protein [Prevotella ruminicola]|uniref:Lipopolysaccharide biosynthesis protein n=1 Tax=Xylanibacter ruminicola TaxID=839 RepID=A0A9D5P0R4_XYLRU|nr:lipopolysaccharide biosynthesis protein [Xylanibacter ruminicola]